MSDEQPTCTDCGTTEELTDCGDSGFICLDCGADRYEAYREPR